MACDRVEILVPMYRSNRPRCRCAGNGGQDRPYQLPQFLWIALLDVSQAAQRDLVHLRGIGTQRTQAADPIIGFERGFKLHGVRAVDAVEIGLRVPRLGIGHFHRFLEGRA